MNKIVKKLTHKTVGVYRVQLKNIYNNGISSDLQFNKCSSFTKKIKQTGCNHHRFILNMCMGLYI
jgi:hypothetical protein